MIIKYSSDDKSVEVRHVHCFQSAGTVKLIAGNGELLGIFRVEGIEGRVSMLEDEAERHACDRHAAAIEPAIPLARVPKSTEIAWTPDNNGRRSEILARKPSQADYTVLAIAHGDEVVFANDIAEDARSGDGQ
jgi:hypothetical protein